MLLALLACSGTTDVTAVDLAWEQVVAECHDGGAWWTPPVDPAPVFVVATIAYEYNGEPRTSMAPDLGWTPGESSSVGCFGTEGTATITYAVLADE